MHVDMHKNMVELIYVKTEDCNYTLNIKRQEHFAEKHVQWCSFVAF